MEGIIPNQEAKKALVSVSDKTALVPFCQALCQLGYEIYATSGSATVLQQASIACRNVADLTGTGEIFGGKLKTLHMQLFAAVLCNPDDPAQQQEVTQLGLTTLALVAINFYSVPKDLPPPGRSLVPSTDHIDIGGPALLRAAAKNHHHVIPVCDPHDYETVVMHLRRATLSTEFRTQLAAKALRATSCYDAQLSSTLLKEASPSLLALPLTKQRELCYGENPHQRAALYIMPSEECAWQQIQGAELSYNNLLDIDAGVRLVQEFTSNTAAIIKHGNPCGVASGDDPCQTFVSAKEGDARSAFGGVVVLNYEVERETAVEIAKFFWACVAAPQFSDAALQVLASKKNLRVVPVPWLRSVRQDYEVRSLTGAWLWQETVHHDDNRATWQLVTTTTIAASAYDDLHFAQRVAKRVKSNAVVLVKNRQLLAAGGGQTSRIDALQLASKKLHDAGHTAQGLVLASDGFFPFADWVAEAQACGVVAVIQPGGAQRDHESIAACDAHGISMIFSGVRGFSH